MECALYSTQNTKKLICFSTGDLHVIRVHAWKCKTQCWKRKEWARVVEGRLQVQAERIMIRPGVLAPINPIPCLRPLCLTSNWDL